jgi:uncharacterized short protein YbdD (DUF466 family)
MIPLPAIMLRAIPLRAIASRAVETARLMVGVGSYTAYRAHMTDRHPDREAMTEAEFFRARQQARYGGGQGRCC